MNTDGRYCLGPIKGVTAKLTNLKYYALVASLDRDIRTVRMFIVYVRYPQMRILSKKSYRKNSTTPLSSYIITNRPKTLTFRIFLYNSFLDVK